MRAWGVEHVPRRGGVVLAANHQSFLDPPLVGAALSRQLYFMARRSLFDVPLLGPLIRAVHSFPVERDGADLGAMRKAIRILRAGGGVLLFPEGTRTPDGEVKTFKAGFALLASRARVPIVPAALHGAFEAWPRHRAFPTPGRRISVAYGEALPAPDRDKAACRAAAAEVQRRVAELLEVLKSKN
jgi:1-acyl-sn-glycerol-3-phosphate acyltransferase